MNGKYNTLREQKKEEITSMILAGIQHSKLTLISKITSELKKSNTSEETIQDVTLSIEEDARIKIKKTPMVIQELFKKSDKEIENVFNELFQQFQNKQQ